MKQFNGKVKTVTANVAKREITVAFVMRLDEDNLAVAESLGLYAKTEAPSVLVMVEPGQMAMDVVLTKRT